MVTRLVFPSSRSAPATLEGGPDGELRLQTRTGRRTPADPPTLKAAVPNWQAGDVIALGSGRALRVVDTRLREDSDGEPVLVLVVEPA
jgi:hypothetical protein